eukprot:scaffold30135_cov45-Prasinocladus_malaysianus.AAC.1
MGCSASTLRSPGGQQSFRIRLSSSTRTKSTPSSLCDDNAERKSVATLVSRVLPLVSQSAAKQFIVQSYAEEANNNIKRGHHRTAASLKALRQFAPAQLARTGTPRPDAFNQHTLFGSMLVIELSGLICLTRHFTRSHVDSVEASEQFFSSVSGYVSRLATIASVFGGNMHAFARGAYWFVVFESSSGAKGIDNTAAQAVRCAWKIWSELGGYQGNADEPRLSVHGLGVATGEG